MPALTNIQSPTCVGLFFGSSLGFSCQLVCLLEHLACFENEMDSAINILPGATVLIGNGALREAVH